MRWLRYPVIALVILFAGAALGAWAGHAPGTVPSYTGCLTSNGAINKIKRGTSPLAACVTGEVRIHLSGGDITGVVPETGGGLVGGASSGIAELGLDYSSLDARYVNTSEAAGAVAYARVLPASGFGSVPIDMARSFNVIGAQLVGGPVVVMYCFDLVSTPKSATGTVDVSEARGQYGGVVVASVDSQDPIFAPCPAPFRDAVAVVRDINNQNTFQLGFYIVFH